MKQKSTLGRIKKTIIVVILIVILYQGFSAIYDPLVTDTVIYYEATEGLEAEGIIIRDETVLKSEISGVKNYLVNDGGKVAKDGVIINVYDSEEAAKASVKSAKIQNQISLLEEVQSYKNLSATDLGLINSRIKSNLIALLSETQQGNLKSNAKCEENLLKYMNRKQMITGEAIDFSNDIKELKAQKEVLDAQAQNYKEQIKSEESGYFVSSVDGYENIFSAKNIDSILVEDIEQAIPQDTKDPTIIGKIVTGYDWYIAMTIPIEDSFDYSEGDEINLKTSLDMTPVLVATIKKINRGEKGDTAMVLLQSNSMNEELAKIRKMSFSIIKNSSKGLRIGIEAIRVVDGVKGVYVLVGDTAKFLPVNVLYSNESYAICEQQVSTDDVLRLYDKVIVKGKNLYDGKIVN